MISLQRQSQRHWPIIGVCKLIYAQKGRYCSKSVIQQPFEKKKRCWGASCVLEEVCVSLHSSLLVVVSDKEDLTGRWELAGEQFEQKIQACENNTLHQ